MQRKDIEVGKVYAVGSGQRTDTSTAWPVKILAIGEPKEINQTGVVSYRRRSSIKVSGIVAMKVEKDALDAPYTGPPLEEVEIGTREWSARVGEPFYVASRGIWETWQDWSAEVERRQAREVQRDRELAARVTTQQAEIDHLMSLLPAQAWKGIRDGLGRPLHFEPGATPRLTVGNLTALLKAARTAALDEAFGEEK